MAFSGDPTRLGPDPHQFCPITHPPHSLPATTPLRALLTSAGNQALYLVLLPSQKVLYSRFATLTSTVAAAPADRAVRIPL